MEVVKVDLERIANLGDMGTVRRGRRSRYTGYDESPLGWHHIFACACGFVNTLKRHNTLRQFCPSGEILFDVISVFWLVSLLLCSEELDVGVLELVTRAKRHACEVDQIT